MSCERWVESNNMHIIHALFFLRLYNKFARTQYRDDLYWAFHFFLLLRSGADLNAVHEKFAGVELVEASIGLPLLRGLEDK